jgi:hypothetical protein
MPSGAGKFLVGCEHLRFRNRSRVTTTSSGSQQLNNYPFWAPRFWHGMLPLDFLRMLIRNRFHVHPYRWGLVVTVGLVAILNSILRGISNLVYSRTLAQAQSDRGIVFIIGHWRSGTTLLHELLVLDDRMAFPTTYECFAANHFLLTAGWLPKLIWFLLPAKRPMDDMAVSFDHPQEDEFALISLGAPSPLLRMAFPNDDPPYMEFLDMDQVDERDLRTWKDRIRQFVVMQMYRKQKPLVLKSPTHTGRIQILAEMFPQAKFIHITRNPFELFSSTRRLWTALDEAQTFHRPHEKNLDEYVFAALERMYHGFERQRPNLPADSICDLRYEDLIRQPVESLKYIYQRLGLGDFERVRPMIEKSMEQRRGYKINRHSVPEPLRAEIERRWADYFESYGYSRATHTADVVPAPR